MNATEIKTLVKKKLLKFIFVKCLHLLFVNQIANLRIFFK